MVDGEKLESVKIDSGVPQRTALKLFIFLLHINNLPDIVTSTTCLFADDCLVYRVIRTKEDQITLQKDLCKEVMTSQKPNTGELHLKLSQLVHSYLYFHTKRECNHGFPQQESQGMPNQNQGDGLHSPCLISFEILCPHMASIFKERYF